MTTVNLIIFGIGNVGGTLINQIIESKNALNKFQDLDLNIPVIANSRYVFFNTDNIGNQWQSDFENFSVPYKISEVINYVNENFENAIIIDATASEDFVQNYPAFIEIGFHIAAANKVANTLDYSFYSHIRSKLRENKRQFQYETNVGAGLPVIDTVKSLQVSGDKITKIRGVFSGSLSYIFKQASENGFTEPDVRDDLSGKDVARKLLILAREIGFELNLEDVEVKSLIPPQLNGNTSNIEFNNRIKELDKTFQDEKYKQSSDVLRYVGELDTKTSKLTVSLTSESKASPIGQLKHTDNLIEIYSQSYQEQPLVIQGAGAGKEVTARGLFSDIIKIAKS